MYAANATGSKETHASHIGTKHRPGYRRRAQLARGQSICEVTPADRLHMSSPAQLGNLVERQTNFNLASDNTNGRRYCTLIADSTFHGLCDLDISGIWQAMGNDRRFEDDNWPLFL